MGIKFGGVIVIKKQ